MADAFYLKLADTANRLLTSYGAQVTLTRGGVGAGVYDPDTGNVTVAGPAQSFVGRGAAFGYKANEIDGTLILEGDRKVLIAPNLGTVPQAGDTITLIDGAVLQVIESMPLAPAGPLVLHEVHARDV